MGLAFVKQKKKRERKRNYLFHFRPPRQSNLIHFIQCRFRSPDRLNLQPLEVVLSLRGTSDTPRVFRGMVIHPPGTEAVNVHRPPLKISVALISKHPWWASLKYVEDVTNSQVDFSRSLLALLWHTQLEDYGVWKYSPFTSRLWHLCFQRRKQRKDIFKVVKLNQLQLSVAPEPTWTAVTA